MWLLLFIVYYTVDQLLLIGVGKGERESQDGIIYPFFNNWCLLLMRLSDG